MCMHASQYALYQHFLHTPDQQVEALLRLFTTVPCSDIDEAIAAHEAQPDRRTAQRLLARQVTTDVRGESSCRSAEQVRLARLGVAAAVHALTPRVTRRLARCCLVAPPPICGRVTCWKWLKRYGPTRHPLCCASLPLFTQVCAGTRHSDDSGRLRRRQRRGHCPWRWPSCFQRCVLARATCSRWFACVELSTHATPCLRVPAEAKRLTKAGGLYLNNERVGNAAKPPSLDDLIDGTVCLLRSGKRKNVLVRVEA